QLRATSMIPTKAAKSASRRVIPAAFAALRDRRDQRSSPMRVAATTAAAVSSTPAPSSSPIARTVQGRPAAVQRADPQASFQNTGAGQALGEAVRLRIERDESEACSRFDREAPALLPERVRDHREVDERPARISQKRTVCPRAFIDLVVCEGIEIGEPRAQYL